MTGSFKEVVFRMVAQKKLTAAQALALVGEVRSGAGAGSSWIPVAVVGLSGQFPGARNVEEFWDNLNAGRCSIGEVPPARWDLGAHFDPDPQRPNKTNCKWGGFLDGIKELDSLLFNISPREAELMDPQQCYFLEQAWNALEDAGYSSRDLSGSRCGVFVGAGAGDFLHKMTAEGIAPDGYAFMGNAVSILAARVSYLLNLKGPALAVDTACSSSLVAIHLACQSISAGTCDLAIAGGVCVLNTPGFYIAAAKTGMLSPSGKLRAFDRGADGFIPGEAAGALVLKRLDDAIRDGDHIYGVIEGAAMNQDGRTNGITAPSGPSQTALELEVYRRFGIAPESIGYLEAHGTGTPLGDPIEIEALAHAFHKFTGRKQFCAVGSVKTNVGHTMTAAGVVSMIRVLLSLDRRRLTPSLHFSGDNPAIGFAETPFYVNTESREWASGGPRRAAVSAFGFSGTNVHMVVREAPERERAAASARPRLFALSARSDAALQRRAADLAAHLRRHPDLDLDAVSFTLNAGRTHFDCRAVVAARDAGELARELERGDRRAGELPEIAKRFLAGEEVDWSALYGPASRRRIPLPTYPFERRPHGFAEHTRAKVLSGIHPLLDAAAPCAESPVYRTSLAAGNPFLRDHQVNGQSILPGVCYLEMACAGVEALGSAKVRGIRDVVWLRPLTLRDGAIEVVLRLTPEGGRFAFQVETDGSQTPCCRGVVSYDDVSRSDPPRMDLDAVRRRCDYEIDAASLYAKFREGGVHLGPFCQGVEHIWMADDAALGELRIPGGESASLAQYALHPTVLDGAFQTAMAWLGRRLGKGSPVLVPSSIGEIEMLRPLPARCYAYVEPHAGEYRFNVALLDESGALLTRIRDFCARPLLAQAKPQIQAQAAEVPCFEPVWIEETAGPAEPPDGITVIFRTASDLGFSDAGSRWDPKRIVLQVVLGETYRSVANGIFEIDHRRQEDYERLLRSLKPVGRIYFTAFFGREVNPDDLAVLERAQETSVLSLFRLLRGLRHLRQPAGALYVLTNDAQPAAPGDSLQPLGAGCVGLAMSAAREYRALPIHIVDLRAAELAQDWLWPLLDAESGAASGTVSAYRAGRRYCRHLQAAANHPTSPAPLRTGGVYAIAGGAGGLGLTFARHLGEVWHARLLLLGRNPLSASQEAALAEIRALGGEVLYERADLTDEAAVAHALGAARARWGRFHGVIQAAMVLADRAIEAMDEDSLRAVLAPKARGTAVLLRALADDTIDFAALFSSANSFFGNAGQGNYAAASTFQDAYGLYAGARVINWGFWGGVGAVASPFYRDQASKYGVGSITAAEGAVAFERALREPALQVMPMKITARRLAELGIPVAAPPSERRFQEIVEAFVNVERYGRALLLAFFQSKLLFRTPGERITRSEAEATVGLQPKYRRLFDALLAMLARQGVLEVDGEWIRTAGAGEPASSEFADWVRPFARLIAACLAQYGEVLSGALPATAVMFPKGSLELVEPLYKRNPISDFFNVQVAEAVARQVPGLSGRVRIVEIGAGTGGVTAGVLEALRPYADRVEYHYTDVSHGFVRHGQNHFGETPFLRFGVLDIEKDPGEQGFAEGSFDLAVASNVLHATSDILDTLRNVRRLLKAGGLLILNEATRVQDFSTLTFGLTDGFWLYRDPERRLPHSPLLDEAGWRAVLLEAGFTGFTAAPSSPADSSQAVLLAAADTSRPAQPPAPAAIPEPTDTAPAVSDGVAAHVESVVRSFVAQALNLSPGDLHSRKRFSEYGVDSIVGVELIERLNRTFGADLRVTALFDHGSVRDLTAHLVDAYGSRIAARRETAPHVATRIFDEAPRAGTRKIAVTGMSGRFPGAPELRRFWENLRAGESAIREVPRERWDVSAYYDPEPGKPGKSPCKWGGFLSGIDQFDPLFFQMSGVEAQYTDPQQRLFLEECWKAFEDAGYPDRSLNRKKCGVFAGVTAGDYLQNTGEESPYAFLGNGVSILAARIAYLLNLKGPALAVDTACSSSLVALHLACQSILNGECEMALAGGVFLTTTPAFHRLTGNLGMLSPTGTCSAFDDRADGFVPGEGVGVVVLRPLEDAIREGDHIYGVILATGTNQDGNTNGITAPSSQSQTELELEVYRKAGIDPATLSYIETHGTGTKLGDPVEIEGLKQAFARFTDRKEFCAIGSVKTNIGHAGPAAGIAGLIKVLLALEHREIPASLNFETANRHIRFGETPFYVNREARSWNGNSRRAAVSAFGLSGTNAHVVVEEAPAPPVASPVEWGEQLVTVSAKSPEALRERLSQLAEWLERDGARHRLDEIAYTLNAGRSHFEHRVAFVAHETAELIRQLRGAPSPPHPIAQSYVAGQDPEWDRVYQGRRLRRISLPPYPFRRDSYWVAAKSLPPANVSLFRKIWQRADTPALLAATPAWIVAVDETPERARAIEAQLRAAVRWTRPGEELRLEEGRGVVLYFASRESGDTARVAPLHPLFALASQASRRPFDVIVFHEPGDTLQDCILEASAAISRSLAVVAPTARWTTAAVSGSEAVLRATRFLLAQSGRWPAELRSDEGVIQTPDWVAADDASSPVTPIRRGGVYWITGGGGALGRMLADYLVREYAAHVILTSRRAVPTRESIECMEGDAADPARMRAIAERIRRTHGAIHGVFHAAGAIVPELVSRKTPAQADSVLSPKVLGAIALDEATHGDALDFFVLFSSLSAVAGDFGQCDYAVANRFLDSFAERRARMVAEGSRRGKTVSIGWPLWAEGGMRPNVEEERAYLAASGLSLLAERDGLRAMERCLANPWPHVLVLAGDAARLPAFLAPPQARAEAPSRDIEAHLRDTIAGMLRLQPRDLVADACLSTFGLDSLNMKDLAARLSGDYRIDLSPTVLFEHNTIAALAAHLSKQQFAPPSPAAPPPGREPIAIVGASGRFPQSIDLDEFWDNLIAGRDLITEIPPDRWNWRDYDGVSRWGGFMPEIDRFDAAFFGVSPREAALMDPQHRIFLETVWKTLEDAGCRPSSLGGRKIGVFVGAQLNEYMQLIGDAGEAKAQAALGNTHTMLANRVSYWFDFHGPSETIDTACSSALVAVHRAVRAIQNGDCEIAIAGGVSVILSPDTYVLSTHLGMLSPDGRCKTFDKTANGYVKGEGAGAVLLKPLSRAIADGDNIQGVILSTAENHGGRANFLTAPNPEAQAALLKTAYGRAGIDPRSVSYVEAHGTGTELGDPIEVDALKRAFRELAEEAGAELPDRPFCGLGTVKSNVGHLEPAAGIAGLLKVVLALRHRRLPATLHVHDVNPYLRLADGPFYLVTAPREWESPGGGPRRAGVSAFGFGGSNAHVVVEEHDAPAAPVEPAAPQVFPFSARDEERLRALADRFRAFLIRAKGLRWRDVAHTLQAGREPMKERLAVVAASPEELLAKLADWQSAGVYRGSVPGKPTTAEAPVDPDLAARLWTAGAEIDWVALHAGKAARRVSLPTYPFARTRHWFDIKRPEPARAMATVAAAQGAPVATPATRSTVDGLRHMLAGLLYLDAELIDDDAIFTDLGLDSILAVEFVKHINDAFGTNIRATRLYDYGCLSALAKYVGECVKGGGAAAPVPPRNDVKAALTEMVADALYLDCAGIDEETSFTELGLDSILAVELVKKINERFGIDLRATRLYDYTNIRDLSAYLAGAGGGAVEPPETPVSVPAAAVPAAAGNAIPEKLKRLVAATLSLSAAEIDDDVPLMELGLDLVSAAELANVLKRECGASIRPKDLLCMSSLRQLAADVDCVPAAPPAVPPPPKVAATDVAIVGMSGRFPGAANLDEFWANLAGGVDSVTEVPSDRWPIERYFDPNPGVALKTYCRKGGFLKDVDQFDPLFFQISPQEAEWMDPQQRLFLEESWLALEDAGYPDTRLSQTNCGVYVGVSQGDYFQLVDTTSAAASQFSLGNVNSILAARIAYFLNLKGPAVALDTACSSSLVAIHLACQSLRAGECEMALAGGVSVMTTPHMHLLGSQGRMLSADGKCRTFDAAADGFVPAEGAGAIVLKLLSDALRDGDRIHAVIRGTGVNQDGKTNGITAPSAQSQAALESAVYQRFGLDPATFGYVEAHGTGTALGDPIEVDALTESFRRYTAAKGFCAIGSVKTNIGHSLPAAGIAGLLKTVLSMERGQIPPTLHCERENGQIDFGNSPFFVNRELLPWPGPRRAAVSSFGFSGTNGHIVVEEPPAPSRPPASDVALARVFCLSAKTPEALRRAIAALQTWLIADGGRSRLDDLSYTLCVRRSAFRHRVAIVATTRQELLDGLSQPSAIPSGGPIASMAAAWMRGETVDWAAQFKPAEVRVLTLPGYPFVRRRCWARPVAAAAGSHPLLDECRPGFTEARASKRFDPSDPVIRDHQVLGQGVLPGVVYLEMARAALAAVEHGFRMVELRNMVWKAPFRLEGQNRELGLRIRPSGGNAAFEFLGGQRSHAQCDAVLGEPAAASEPPRQDIARLMELCPTQVPADRVYDTFAAMGIVYGPSFRCLEWVRVGERDVVARIAAPPRGQHDIHPGALDAALQSLIGFALGDASPGGPVTPFALDRYCVFGTVDGPCFAHAHMRGDRFDIWILSPEGRVLVAFEGFSARRMKRDDARIVLYQPAWEPAPAVARGNSGNRDSVLIFRGPEDLGLAAALTRAHAGSPVASILLGKEFHPSQVNRGSEVDYERALGAAGAVSRIYFLGGLCGRQLLRPEEIEDFQEGSVLSLFRLVKAITRQDSRPEVVIVTNNVHRVLDADPIHAQAASLAGFARVLAAEFPELRVALVDLEAGDDDSAARALAGEVGESPFAEIALRGGKRFRRTLTSAPAAPASAPLPLRDRGVYIILGGMGGLGLTFARHLAATCHARLLLVGRGGLTREKQQAIHDLNALGGEAVYRAADITGEAQMSRLREEVLGMWGAVNGVIHSAFVLRDMSLLRMDEATFREALDPKVCGTAVVLWTFRKDKLDWVALFSSSISFTGGTGQANYAAGSTLQDTLGLCWNAEGGWPVRVLNWGYWGEVGSVASEVYRARVAALGVGSIDAVEGVEAFRQVLAGSAAQIVVAKVDPAAKQAGGDKQPGPAPASRDAIHYLRGVVSAVLQLTGDDLQDDRPFEEYGVDSLVSLTIVGQLESDLGPLPKTLLFEHNTIRNLAGFLTIHYPVEVGRLVSTDPAPSVPSLLFPIRETGPAAKSFWVHSVVGEMNWAVRLAHHMGPEWPVYGFKAAALDDGKPPYARLEDMAAAYVKAMRAVQPHGPYNLGGFSFGGSVAFEMARQLGDAGERVSWLVLLDAYAPGSGALESLTGLSWDGFLPQMIANLLIHQWKGGPFLKADALPRDDVDAQIRIAAKHVRGACNIPQTEAEIAAVLTNSVRAANLHAELQQNYQARQCPAVDNAVLVRNRFGFVGAGNALGLPRTVVNDTAPDHGWSRWLPAPPQIFEVDADHCTLGLEPAIETVGRQIAQLLRGAPAAAHGHRQRVFNVVKEHVLRVLPDLPSGSVTLDARLKDLGANSLDRIEVATCAMEELEIDVPRTRLAGVDSLQSLVDALLGSLPGDKLG